MSIPAKYLLDYEQTFASYTNPKTDEKVNVNRIVWFKFGGIKKISPECRLKAIYELKSISEEKWKELRKIEEENRLIINASDVYINFPKNIVVERLNVNLVPANETGLKILAEIDEILDFPKYDDIKS